MKRFPLLVITFQFLLLPIGLSAAQIIPNKLTVPLPGLQEFPTPSEYITAIYTFALGLGTLLAMLMIVIGAVQYTLSESATKKEDRIDRITSAVLGLSLLLAATLILNFVNPQIPELSDPTVPLVTVPGKLPGLPGN